MIAQREAGPQTGLWARLAAFWTGGRLRGILADVDDLPELWTVAEAGRRVGLSRQRMHALVKAGKGPQPSFRFRWHDQDMLALYRPEDVRAWAESVGRRIAY